MEKWRPYALLLLFAVVLGIVPANRPAISELAGSEPVPLKYAALGDSITSGHDLLQGEREGFVPRYKAFIEADTGATVELVNLGVNDQSSSGLLRALRTNAGFRQHVREAQVLTLDIGTNDLLLAHSRYVRGKPRPCGGRNGQKCLRAATARFRVNYDAILREIETLREGKPTVVRAATLYNPFTGRDKKRDSHGRDGEKSDAEVFAAYYRAFNRYIAATANRHEVPYADVHRTFNGPASDQDLVETGYLLPLPDGVHPSDRGHAAIADLMRDLGYAPLNT